MNMTIAALLLVQLAAGAKGPGPKEALPRVFVADVQGPVELAPLLEAVSVEVATTLSKAGRYDVVGAVDVREIASLEQQKQIAGCDDNESCLADIAGALGARYVVTGRVVPAGGSYLIQLTLFDTVEARVVGRSSNAGLVDELVTLGRVGARGLLGDGSPLGDAPPEKSLLPVWLGAGGIVVGVVGAGIGTVPLIGWLGASADLDTATTAGDVVGLARSHQGVVAGRDGWHSWGLPLVIGGAVVAVAGMAGVAVGLSD